MNCPMAVRVRSTSIDADTNCYTNTNYRTEGVKALVTLSVMSVMGKKLLDPIFYFVAKSSSHEAFLSIILTTVLLMSFVTQGLKHSFVNL